MTPGTGTSQFLLSLAAAIADLTSLTLGRQLFVHQVAESVSSLALNSGGGTPGPCSVLRVYGGPAPFETRNIPGVSVQCFSVGPNASDVFDQADAVFASLRDDAGVARNDWMIPAKTIADNGSVADATGSSAGDWLVHLVTPIAPPGVVGRDERGYWNVSFNFDVRFRFIQATTL